MLESADNRRLANSRAACARWLQLSVTPGSGFLMPFVALILVWIVTAAIAGRGTGGTLTAAIEVGTFSLVTGIGQMFVITGGNGGIDLSVPNVISLSAYVSATVASGSNGMLLPSLGVGIAVGLVAALASVVLIELARIPPIIATLAVGFMLNSVVLEYAGSSNASAIPSPGLGSFVSGDLGPIPVFGIVGVVLTLLAAVVLRRTGFGRSVEAVGQSAGAARFAGIHVIRTRAITYCISGVCAGIAGVLLCAYAGGPTANIGDPYELGSIAVVVLGGCLITGGRSNTPGVWAAAVLLSLVVTLVEVAHLAAGFQDVVEGLIIVAVLAGPSRSLTSK
jgi:ribose transport system permease protein